MTQEFARVATSAGSDVAPSLAAPLSADIALEPVGPSIWARLGAEAFGTFVLIFIGVGAALMTSTLGLGQLGVAFAFAIALIAATAAVGHVSGGHFNPAVTFGLTLAGRSRWADLLPYWVSQIAGGTLATLVLWVALPRTMNDISGATETMSRADLFEAASNGFGEHSPAYGTGPSMVQTYLDQGATTDQIKDAIDAGQITVPPSIDIAWSNALLIELVAAAVFVGIFLAVIDKRVSIAYRPVVIGLSFGAAVLITLPFTNGSVNPARSFASAVFAGGSTWGQIWVFVVGSLIGAALAALFYRGFAAPRPEPLLGGVDADGLEFFDETDSVDGPVLAAHGDAVTDGGAVTTEDTVIEVTETEITATEVATPEADATDADAADEPESKA